MQRDADPFLGLRCPGGWGLESVATARTGPQGGAGKAAERLATEDLRAGAGLPTERVGLIPLVAQGRKVPC